MLWTFLLVLGLSVAAGQNGLAITAPPSAVQNFTAPTISWLTVTEQPPVEGILVPWKVDAPLSAASVNGCVVVFNLTDTSRSAVDILLHLESLGVVGVIIADAFSDVPGFFELRAEVGKWHLIQITVVTIGKADSKVLDGLVVAHRGNLTVLLTGLDDTSQWRTGIQSPVWYFVQVIMALMAASCAALALAKLIGFLRATKKLWGIAQICLFIEAWTHTLRSIVWSLQPTHLQRGAYNYTTGSVLGSIPLPWSIVCMLLLALYWFVPRHIPPLHPDRAARRRYDARDPENSSHCSSSAMQTEARRAGHFRLELVLQDRIVVRSNLSTKLQLPFAIISVIVVGLDITAVAIRNTAGGTSVASIVAFVFELVVQLSVSIFFVAAGYKVINEVRSRAKNSNTLEKSAKLLTNLTRLVITSSVLVWVSIIVGIIAATPVFYYPAAYFMVQIARDFLHYGISMSRILVFKVPTRNVTTPDNSASPRTT